MAVVRVKAPEDADPYVVEAVLARAICDIGELPVSAEITMVPTMRRRTKRGLCRHGFVAVLHSTEPAPPGDLLRIAEKAARAGVRARFGSTATAKVRPVRADRELLACWCSVRGTPHKIGPSAAEGDHAADF